MKCRNCGGEWNPPKNMSLTICPFCGTPIIEKEDESDHLQPYEIVKNIVEKYGPSVFLDSRKLSALIMDFFTEKTKEKNILGIAVHAGIPKKIISASNWDSVHRDMVYRQCKIFLCEDYGMSEKWADFAIYCFTYALGWNTDKKQKYIPDINNNYYTKEQNASDEKSSKNHTSLKDIVADEQNLSFSDNINLAVDKKQIYSQKEEIKKAENKKEESIASKIFKRYRNLKNIPISNNIVSADLGIDEVNGNLAGSIIPSTITSIEYKAFANRKDLISIIIPSSVMSIGSEAFAGCTNLKSIIIPKTVASIGDGAFKGCINLKEIVVDRKNIKYCSNDGMLLSYDMTKLLSYPSAIIANIPNGITYIGNSAFADCENLTSIIIPKTVTSIEYNAFWGCINLKNIIIDKKNIPFVSKNGMIFDYYKTRLISCPSAVNVEIPDTVTHIGYGAFGGCRNLESIVIPNSVTSIGNYSFEGCINLKSISIPERVTFIADSAFDGCISLKDINIDKKNLRYSSKDGILFNYNKTSLFCYPSAIEAKIPDTVSHICDSAFLGCGNLRKVYIPKSVISIGYMAFAGCKNLMHITIPSSVTSIGNYAFLNCNKLIVRCKSNSYVHRYCIENSIAYDTY